MKLSNHQKKQFRAIGHQLHPVVTVGPRGLTEGVLKELDRALQDHELIKIKINLDREKRKATLSELLESLAATQVQSIGSSALIYKPAEEPDPHLSNLLRADILLDPAG